MSDAVAVKASAEPVQSVSPAPDLAVDVETAASDAAPVEAVASAEAPAPVDHLGVLRRSVLDHLLDTAEAEPQSVSEILAAMPPGTSRNTLESALRRAHEAGHVERVTPGTYRLAPAPKPKPSSPPPEEEHVWFDALEPWVVDPSSWDVDKLGPPLQRTIVPQVRPMCAYSDTVEQKLRRLYAAANPIHV